MTRSGGGGGKRKYNGHGGSGGGGGGRSNKRAFYGKPGYDNTNIIAGPGIFLTTERGRERKAALQLVDVLEEHALRLYPDVKLELHVLQHKQPTSQKALTEEDEDALWNGATEADAGGEPAAPEGAQAAGEEARPSPPLSKEESKLDDVQAQIQAELAELHGGSSSSRATNGGFDREAGADGVRPPPKVPRFGIVTDNLVDCVAFVRVTPPQDPHALVYSLLEEVERTGGARCRYVQRLVPVYDTCVANYDAIEELADRVLPHIFTAARPRTYRIEPRIRAHTVVKRDSVIKNVAEQIPDGQGHSVHLNEPDLVVMVEILKNVCGIGVAEHWMRFKRLNPAMVAEDVAKRRNESNALAQATTSNGEGAHSTTSLGRVAVARQSIDTVGKADSDQPQDADTAAEDSIKPL